MSKLISLSSQEPQSLKLDLDVGYKVQLTPPAPAHQGQAGQGWSRVIVMTERLHWPVTYTTAREIKNMKSKT